MRSRQKHLIQGCTRRVVDGDSDGHSVNKFIGAVRDISVGPQPAQTVNHAPTHSMINPGIAVHDPNNVSLCLRICAAHVAYLRVRPKSVGGSGVGFHEDPYIAPLKIMQQLFDRRKSWIISGFDANVHTQAVGRVVLAEAGGETIVEKGFEAFDWTDYRHAGCAR